MSLKQQAAARENGKTGGRPVTTGPTPAMQLGRVHPEIKSRLHEAAAKRGKTFTSWALGILLREAAKALGR